MSKHTALKEGKMPESRKEQVVTHVGKPGRDASSPSWINSASRLKKQDVAKLSVFTDRSHITICFKYSRTKHVLMISVFFS